ncbi:metal-dependent transcriptional regulator [Clostridium sporogenes]|uniref:metal-dependent transcriptional regulator n=1 Tax=Clostridium sporogenes TaxID=1509 RepID=UPI0022384C64|nr:metal-dependent transcriptional regulator [Clostridium sporogenes]EKS4342623.1 metal-dependent transcriptional regulator [Clostridium botulinum]EKS4395521.1 metal-dependent transcriptional regulator [Clostridium botulinum]MCW6077803.1 metal-dependent transcriptional regulator [Clostridium sporogenes]
MPVEKLSISKENYLKTILSIEQEQGYVRAIDIAKKMELSRPSVSHAIHLLKQEKYIHVDDTHNISFTPQGFKLACAIKERYVLFYNLLLSLGVPATIASFDACRMEHAISNETLLQLKKVLI